MTDAYQKSRKPPERAKAARDMANKAGRKTQLFYTMGKYDFAEIIEVPEDDHIETISDEVLSMLVLFLFMLLRHLASILALPFIVVCILPIALVGLFPYVSFWGIPYYTAMFLLVAGIVFSGLGFFLLYSTISLFIKKGNGTIAPQDSPKKLMVIGIYAHVRNPIHIGVFLILTGESIIIGSIALAVWTLLFIAGNLLYVPLIEERKLAERFGGEYWIYKKHVPRWIPRLSSWKSNSRNQNVINSS